MVQRGVGQGPADEVVQTTGIRPRPTRDHVARQHRAQVNECASQHESPGPVGLQEEAHSQPLLSGSAGAGTFAGSPLKVRAAGPSRCRAAIGVG